MTWPGIIFLKEEDGYKIILKSLHHYKKRLHTLHQSPELQNSAAMFASVLNQEAKKTVPKIDELVVKIHHTLDETEKFNLQDDVDFMQKALSCYLSDIQKAQDTRNKYFLNLVGDLDAAKNDIKLIKLAKSKI